MSPVCLSNNYNSFDNYNIMKKYDTLVQRCATQNNSASMPKQIPKQQKKVSFNEGCDIIFSGAKDTAVNTVKSVVQHPIKTLATMAATTAALTSLPFMGISMATGGAALVTGFGGLAIFNTAKNIFKAHKNSKNGNYDEMRKTLHDLGGNAVDLALTLPFMPKAVKHLSRNVPMYFQKDLAIYKNTNGVVTSKIKKYYGGNATYNYNPDGSVKSVTNQNSLFSQIGKAKTWEEKFNLLLEQDKKEALYEQINKAYRQVAQERGINSAKDIKFNILPIEYQDLGNGTARLSRTGGYVEGGIDSLYTNFINARANVSPEELLKIIGHEHRHVEQNEMMVRAGFIDKKSNFAHNFFADSLKKGKIKPGTPEYTQAKKFNNARINYPKNSTGNNPAYINNFLEVDARNIGETEIAKQIKTKLFENLGCKDASKGTIVRVKYNPTKDIILSNGIIIRNGKDRSTFS